MALSVSGPELAHELGSDLWPALLLPGLLATLAARLVFESIDGALSRRRRQMHLLAAISGAIVGALVMAAAALILDVHPSATVVLMPAGLALLALIGAGLLRDLEIRVRLALRRVYFAGSADSLRELQRELLRSPEARLVGAVSAHTPASADALAETVRGARATVLVLDCGAAHAPAIVTAATALGRRGLHVRDLLSYYEAEFKKVPLTELTPSWFLFDSPDQHRRALSAGARRAIVMLAAGCLLLVSLPLMALLMFLIALTSPGPAIFRQERVGKDGALFTLVKLRTMSVADDSGAWATAQDHRITPLGRVLRRFRLDELPQLWNVLRGELALVGPRPEQVPIVELLEQQIPFYCVRHSVRPGLTGWAQVNLGYSGSLEGARAKLQRDLYYVKHRSLRLDLLILWLTLKAVFTDP
ncbi:MAG: exopolysaccharide biosynthesis polyprenyl glycosylphosphotransferase, partial [Acidobacteriota bacterium]|nr:exopolysaccharide biosynthesis polyprenyl glycosylphosphotransferase [Acidobacteriota bacterium]